MTVSSVGSAAGSESKANDKIERREADTKKEENSEVKGKQEEPRNKEGLIASA